MEIDEQFVRNLLRIMRDAGMTPAELSRKAGLNPRAVKDLEQRRSVSPKRSTAVRLSAALNCNVEDIIRGESRHEIDQSIIQILAQYPPEAQRKLVQAIEALVPPPSGK